MASKKKYKATVQTVGNGFGRVDEKLAKRIKEDGALMVLGYTQWIDYADIEPDTLSFVQKYWDDGNRLMDALASKDYVQAMALLREGEWTHEDISTLLPELDQWAMGLSAERREIGAMALEGIRALVRHGMETYHEALLAKHAESVEATESLQQLLEAGMEATMVDTGAYYDAAGNQEGGRDLVLELANGMEVALTVHHNPRHVDYEGAIPERMKALIGEWEVAA